MHSYQHNIKTFNNATRHLTRVERSLYRDLIELYYDTEQPLPCVDFDKLARRVLAHSDEENTALRYVLSEFFELTGDVYTHDFCDEKIEKYRDAKTAKAKAGKASAEARKKKSADRKGKRKAPKQTKNEHKPTDDEQPLNDCATGEQLTSNHKPVTINHNNNKAYAFDGERIKLTQKDYNKFLKTYLNLDLQSELSQLDIELRDEKDKSWFMTLNAKLNYRNKKNENTKKTKFNAAATIAADAARHTI